MVSLSEDLRRGVDDIVEWARAEPPGRARAEQIVLRYGALLHGLGIGIGLRYEFRELADLIAGPEAPPLAVFHARQALLTISWSLSMMGDLDLDDAQGDAAATRLALDILARL